MKILAIRGKSLASLEGDFEIDFTSEPLKSAGIFAITGQTGAGKSTILDALCLALFDDAPRLNKAEPINISDVEDKTITQKDSRNILRRGASEGYAEVDFIALNGEKYRSRWMVRRARGKAYGALQATIMKVENLSTYSEEQGTKSNLLNRIVELIGLTFDQFTRAVLLAQGDFANFLKAKSNEKAELLEKLTGTEIYSKISVIIYQKNQDARNALDLLQQRIKDVRLLSEVELSSLDQEKLAIEKELSPLKIGASLIEKKLAWIKQEEQIKFEIAQANENLALIHQKIRVASSQYEYIDKLETSMDIRDSYIELANKKIHLEKLENNTELKEKELKSIVEQYDKLISDLNSAKTALEETEKNYNILKPDLTKAREIDLTIKSINQKLTEINNDLELCKKQALKSEENIISLKNQQEKIIQTKENLSKWFVDNEAYYSMIPRVDLIDSLISSISSIKKNRGTTLNSLESSKSLLVAYTQKLKEEEEEAERLNKLLPTEVINLRSKLQVGEPCLVCGSEHHPFKDKLTQIQMINESELENSKKKIQEGINKTKENIGKTQKSITEFETYIQSFQSQIEISYTSLKEHLTPLPNWESKLDSGVLQQELNSIIVQWNENKQRLDNCSIQLENGRVKFEAEEKAKASIIETLIERQGQYKLQETSLIQIIEDRNLLLNGKSVEEVENHYSNQRSQLSKQYDELRTQKDKVETNKASLNGTIAQLTKDIAINKQEIAILAPVVENWVSSNKYQISIEELKGLVSKSREWIAQEKQYLTDIKNQELVAKTTLDERQSRYTTHVESEDKPRENESKDFLTQNLTSILEKYNLETKRLTEINFALLTHNNGKERIKTFEKELSEKNELHESWAKLNELLGSAKGDKFKTIAQGYTLDILLSYANKHLAELSKRYKLEKIPDSLALQVIDNDMLGEIRSVHSLSGGESFLISLALALGLSSLSSNRMKIESLFIDEGFGALDIDTLSIAMDALDNLQTQGRKIGVISHVEEMKERITTQIQVTKSANGRSFLKIVG